MATSLPYSSAGPSADIVLSSCLVALGDWSWVSIGAAGPAERIEVNLMCVQCFEWMWRHTLWSSSPPGVRDVCRRELSSRSAPPCSRNLSRKTQGVGVGCVLSSVFFSFLQFPWNQSDSDTTTSHNGRADVKLLWRLSANACSVTVLTFSHRVCGWKRGCFWIWKSNLTLNAIKNKHETCPGFLHFKAHHLPLHTSLIQTSRLNYKVVSSREEIICHSLKHFVPEFVPNFLTAL